MLFTSYMAVTGVAMLLTGWASSRIGAKRTLLVGLGLVVTFSALAGASDTIGQIVGFRAGWGLGNALFIATALATIVGAASGGVASAIILYEAALGIGIATGPLLGGLLGHVSWRAPFFGTATLMAIGFIAVATLLPATPRPPRRTSLLDPIRALRHRGLLVMGLTALFYNFGFFALLAFTPFPLGMGAIGLGFVFFGWGLALALTSVFAAPRLQRRFGVVPTIRAVLALFTLVLVVMAVFTESAPLLVVMVVVSGLLLGINNTLVTEAVMKVSPVERPVASAGYSFLRFIGGALAPWLAGHLSDEFNDHVPYVMGALGVTVALVVITLGRRYLTVIDTPEAEGAEAAGAAAGPVVLLAVDSGPAAAAAREAAARVALDRGLAVRVLHVREVDVTAEDGIEQETTDAAEQVLADHVDALAGRGVAASGEVRTSVGTHADVARAILAEAARTTPAVIVVGASAQGALARAVGGDVVGTLRQGTSSEVLVVEPDGSLLSRS
jgi:MFS family permease